VLGVVPAEAVRGATSAARTRARPLEAPTGWNALAEVSGDGARLVVSHQTLGAPAELWALDTGGEGRPLQLTRTRPASFEAIDWIRPLPFEAVHEEGTPVRAHVYLPRSSDLARPDRARPAVVFIHGAGYLQNVTDSMTQYEVNLLFHSRLAALGYVVIDVDYRGSEGYGNAFRTAVQYDLGRLELLDIDLVVDALAARGVVDGERVACYGGSYGGFLTLMALFTAPERWVAGAALRSVTDWRTYHPRYTQPRLGRPSTHAEAYARSSPIDLAEGLEDPLLILHGMVDTNVFAQDSIRLIERLIDLGKDFDAMLYPSQGHAFEDGMHWLDEYRRIERFLRRHLGAP
jgi:dipeptidyl aminopeptidase/acylaminoacyl peptidase